MAMTRATERTIALPMYDEGAPDNLRTGLTLTVTISKDGGAFAAATNAAAEIGTTGVYALTLTAAEMDADVVTVKATATGACDQALALVTDPAAAPSASAVADAVRTNLATELAHLDADVSDAVAGDPWTAEVPGDYEEGTAGALLSNLQGALTTLGARAVTIASPVAESGTVTLCAGDDYAAADGRAVTFAVAVEDVPSLTGATLKLKCAEATWTATGATSDGTNWSIVFEPTAAQTAALTAERLAYEVEATLAGGNVLTLATGTLVVMRDIPEVV